MPPLAPWRFQGGSLDFSRPRIMGVVNVTPDSFSDGGRFLDPEAACRQARQLVREGADLLDVGAESTRPGARPVPPDEELRRLLPVIGEVVRLGVPVSVDTAKASVAQASMEAGAAIVNDVTALSDPGMAAVVARTGAGLVLMHMRGTPRTMQEAPEYGDVVGDVRAFLAERREKAETEGVPRDRIVLDPGIGFGKLLEHNLALFARLKEITALGSPVLVGASRKSFIGRLTGVDDPSLRLPGSLAAVLVARLGGAVLFRVHDVEATRQALEVFERTRPAG